MFVFSFVCKNNGFRCWLDNVSFSKAREHFFCSSNNNQLTCRNLLLESMNLGTDLGCDWLNLLTFGDLFNWLGMLKIGDLFNWLNPRSRFDLLVFGDLFA